MNRADARIALISHVFGAQAEAGRAATVNGGDAAVRFLLCVWYPASIASA
jgi:hypothetical protein